ncbi:MAG: hypothetical protein U1D67_00685, partial [Dehalococcoidia bacterium]|nr:hypothetical protein [Dehalococcoidia bacterium]
GEGIEVSSSSLAGEVVSLGGTCRGGGLLIGSLALLLKVWLWDAKYAPTGMVSRTKIYTPSMSLCLKLENIC